MDTVHVTKVICLDENYLFPRCHRCREELSPFRIETSELNKCSKTFVDHMMKLSYLRVNAIAEDAHLIWLCKHCLSNQILVKDK